MVRHDQRIMQVVYKRDQEPDRYKAKHASLTTTYDHPFWAEGEGWTAASRLQGDYLGPSKLRLVDGAIVDLQGPTYIYATDRPTVGWIASNGQEEVGWLFDYSTGEDLPGPVGYDWEKWNVASDDLQPVFRTTVFNIEVEDFHTYYVGEQGVWVHNANCDGITLFIGGVPGPLLPKGTKLFGTEKELIAYITANPGITGFAVVKMPGGQNYVGASPAELTNWLQFEDLVAGRIVKEEVRQEFAVLYKNANEAGNNYIRVEGQVISPSGTRVFVDRKLQFPNLNKLERLQDVLNLLWRVTQVLEQNQSYRWAFEFKAKLNGEERAALQKARELFESIKRNDASTPTFLLKDKNGDYTIPDPNGASKMARVREMLGIGADGRPIAAKIEIQNENAGTAFPQNVFDEGMARVEPLTLADVAALLPRARQAWIDAGASPAMVYSATVRIADLPLGFAGQTNGTEITLDTAGAGWGWYVDAAAEGSSAFELVSDASNFGAHPGSDAENKLDLLTVLIHEIGHVLGMPSSVEGDGVMSQFLSPGQRRLPGATDVAALEAEGMPYFSGGTGVTLVIPSSSSRNNGGSDASDLETLRDRLWPNAGEVDVDDDTVTLLESLARQSHYSKEFIVAPSDRALSFTVTAESLVANSAGPSDAFEVALLDPETGLPLIDPIALTRTDALLNDQSDSGGRIRQLLAAGVHVVDNEDGSKTYVIDLRGVPPGTSALLSFDLIGFGAAQSRVTLGDIHAVQGSLANPDAFSTDEDSSLNGNVLANDVTLSPAARARLVVGTTHGSLELGEDGSFSYRPDANYHGLDTFSYQFAEDDGSLSAVVVVRLVIRPVNDAPLAPGDRAVNVRAGELFTFDPVLGASDVEGSALSPVLASAPAHGTVELNADGTYSYIPRRSYAGTDTFTYRVSDGDLSSSLVTVTATVLPAIGGPVARDLTLQLSEDTSLLIDPSALGIGTLGEAVGSSIILLPTHGTLDVDAEGKWRYRPAPEFSGTDTLRYRLTQDGETSNEATLTLRILPVNDAPVLADRTLRLDEDTEASFDPLVGASDVDADMLVAAVVAGPAHGKLTVNTNGEFSYLPTANYFGADSFTYRVSDGRLSSGTATVTITVIPVDDAPVARDGALALNEGGSLVIDLRSFGSDIDSGELRAIITAPPEHGTLGANADGTFTYRPAMGYRGGDALRFQLSDGTLLSLQATLTLTIGAANHTPTVVDQAYSVAAGGTLVIDPLASAADADGDLLFALLVDPPAHGVLVVRSDGKFSYVAAGGYLGADSFTYRVSDGRAASATATVSLTVTALNQGPTAFDSLREGVEDTALVLRGADFKVSAGSGSLPSIAITALPSEGQLQRLTSAGGWAPVAIGDLFSQAMLDAGTLRFVPAADASGGPGNLQSGDGNRHAHYARIGFKAFDGTLSSEAHVVIDIAAVADIPSLHLSTAQPASGDEDTGVGLPAVVTALSDSDGSESLVLTLTGLPIGATLADGVHSFVVTADHLVLALSGWNIGALQLTPPVDFNGRLTLQVQASAIEGSTGERATAAQDIVIDVVAVADAPLLSLAPRDTSLSRELFATSWESAANPGTAATVLNSATFEGWSVLPAARDRTAAFEVWAEGDRMRNAGGNLATVHAKEGDGSQWLALTNGKTTTYQTIGIERSVPTVAGAVYTLTFDYAGALGLAKGNTRVVFEVDGKRIDSYAATSPNTSLSWQSVSFEFDGNGLPQMLTLRLEGDDSVATSRGAMIDALRVVETLPNGIGDVYGFAGMAIDLPEIVARLKSTAVSEQLRVTIGGLAVGSLLSDGVRSIMVTTAGQVVDVGAWDLLHLELVAPAAFTGTMALTLRATSIEPSNGSTASVEQALAVHVLSGQPATTPVGINPYVTMTPGERSASSTPGAGIVVESSSSSSANPALSSRGQIVFSATPVAPLARKLDDDQEDLDRSSSLRDAWLVELEQLAQQQWRALGGMNG